VVDQTSQNRKNRRITKYLKFRIITAQDGSRDVATCKDTTKIQISSLQYVLRGGHLTHPGHLTALSPKIFVAILAGVVIKEAGRL